MRITFRVRFHTRAGQSLWVSGAHELFGGGDSQKALALHRLNDQNWEATLYLPQTALPESDLVYQYLLREPDGSVVQDWGKDRVLNLSRFDCDHLLVIDSWNFAGFYENAFFTKPFQQVLLKDRQNGFQAPGLENTTATHRFIVKAPLLENSQTLCLLGECSLLGNWLTENPVLLNREPGESYLSVDLDLHEIAFPLAYKYGVYDFEKGAFVRFEGGANRTLADGMAPGKFTLVNDGFAVLPADTWKGAGVSVPVFSLRTEQSFGVGEFADLKKLADWCALTGLKLIQILPVNDTTATHTWLDSYPYAAISAFALHPIYLNLNAVAEGKSKGLLRGLESERLRLNSLEAVDYEAVMRAKVAALKSIYAAQKERTFRSREYKQFFEKNRHWLVPYALFCYLRDQYGTADFTAWPAHRQYVHQADPASGQSSSASALPADSTVPNLPIPAPRAPDALAFHYFVQFHLQRQLAEAAQYAHGRGVVLKGDVPIGVSRHGADAWQSPELYCMEMQAGAPPDAFARKGQNWSFPTYNWPRMKETGFDWWKRRFAQMSGYFDAFRIDHVLGFFRIWSVPFHAVEGIMGRFVPALAVHRDEFTSRGIAFDRTRFVQPWITDGVLSGLFGVEVDIVKDRFLDQEGPGRYRLKPGFATQRQIHDHFARLDDDNRNQKLKEGLFDLVSNVLLFEDEATPNDYFHFRFAIETTPSFQALDPQARSRMWDLYLDYFFRRQDEFWRRQGMEKLPPLKGGTDLLICGEDLGMVPPCVPVVMRDLGLLGLEVQRMPKGLRQEFSRPKEAPYLSVVTPGTHDMSSIRGWWMEDGKITRRFYNHELGRSGEPPATCEPWVVAEIVQLHLDSPAMWSIFQIQDLLGMDEQLRRADVDAERINVPANPRNYWRYRLHLPLEQLLQADSFNQNLRERIRAARR